MTKKELKIQLLQFLISNINKDSRRNNQYVFYMIQPNLMNTTLINDEVKNFNFNFLSGIKNIRQAINLRKFNSKEELYNSTLTAIEKTPEINEQFATAITKIMKIHEYFKIQINNTNSVTLEEQLKNNLQQFNGAEQTFLITTFSNKSQMFETSEINAKNWENEYLATTEQPYANLKF